MTMSNKYHEVLLGFGSNLGDREGYLKRAISLLNAAEIHVRKISPLYYTQPIGCADQEFLNGTLLCETTLSPENLLQKTLLIEKNLGRKRERRWENRIIDLDILMWRTDQVSIIVKTHALAIPHIELLERDFALVPAVDLVPDWLHPVSGISLEKEKRARAYELIPSSCGIYSHYDITSQQDNFAAVLSP